MYFLHKIVIFRDLYFVSEKIIGHVLECRKLAYPQKKLMELDSLTPAKIPTLTVPCISLVRMYFFGLITPKQDEEMCYRC